MNEFRPAEARDQIVAGVCTGGLTDDSFLRFGGLCALVHLSIGAAIPDDGVTIAPRRRGEMEYSMATALDSSGKKSGRKAAADLADYRPREDEPFMNEKQLEYFRAKLIVWKEEILRESQDTLNTLQKEPLREPDITDRASSETDWSIELRTRDRQRKLISKIESALRRIDEGEYGYCEVTGEPISLARLEARPIATMTVEAQERHERQEKISRDE